MKPLSIQLYTVRDLIREWGVRPVLEEIASIGFQGVEGSGYGMSSNEFRALVEDLGMVVSSTWGDIRTPEAVDRLIDTIKTLGTSYAAGGFWVDEFRDVEAIARTADILNVALPRFRSAEVTFGLHNHWMEYELRDGKLAVDLLLERCPDVEFELDVYWCGNFGANQPSEIVRRFRDKIPLMHVKDGPQTNSEAPMTPVGSGTVEAKRCIENANPDKLAWLIVELDRVEGDVMDAVRESYRYLVSNGLAEGSGPPAAI